MRLDKVPPVGIILDGVTRHGVSASHLGPAESSRHTASRRLPLVGSADIIGGSQFVANPPIEGSTTSWTPGPRFRVDSILGATQPALSAAARWVPRAAVPFALRAACPRCGHGVERFPCWQCGYPSWLAAFTLIMLCALAFTACCKPSLTAPGDISSPVLTPSGAIALYQHSYGQVLPWHVETAEASWSHVAPCAGVGPEVLRAFPVLLASGPVACGDLGLTAGCTFLDAHPRIEIIAVSHDFDPTDPDANPTSRDEIARLWRHELIHVALFKRGIPDGDGAHVRPEWECQR